MEQNNQFIDGIYNYCDRWCERCTFTSRCRNYERDEPVDNEALDIENKKFWKGIGDHFESAISMLRQMAAEKGINLDNIPEEETRAWEEKRKHLQQEAREHPLAQLTMQYVQECRQLLKARKVLEEKGEYLIKQVKLGIADENETLKQAKEMGDYLEVIQWYSSFIHIKFQRALQGKMEDDGWQKANGYQTDFDGSAKIAVIGCERSSEAWVALMQYFTNKEDEILNVLALLEKIKRLAAEIFPGYKTFVRPGFDEKEINNSI